MDNAEKAVRGELFEMSLDRTILLKVNDMVNCGKETNDIQQIVFR